MTARVVELALRHALRRDIEKLIAEHPELAVEGGRDRCAAWLAGEPCAGLTGEGPQDGKEDEAADKPKRSNP